MGQLFGVLVALLAAEPPSEALPSVIAAQICESAGWYKARERQCYRVACERVGEGPRDGSAELELGRCLASHGSPPRTAQAYTWAARLGGVDTRKEAYEGLRKLPPSVFPAGGALLDDESIQCGAIGLSLSSCDRSFNGCVVKVTEGNAGTSSETERVFIAYELPDAFAAATGKSLGRDVQVDLSVTEGASCRVQCLADTAKGKTAVSACVRACRRAGSSLVRRAVCRIVFADACDGRVAISCEDRPHGAKVQRVNKELEVPGRAN